MVGLLRPFTVPLVIYRGPLVGYFQLLVGSAAEEVGVKWLTHPVDA